MPKSPFNFYDNEYIQSAMGQEASSPLNFHMQDRIPHHVYYAETFGDRTREAPGYYGGITKDSIRYNDVYTSTAGATTAFEAAFGSAFGLAGAGVGSFLGPATGPGAFVAPLVGAGIGDTIGRGIGSFIGNTIGAAHQDELNSINYIFQSTKGIAGGGLDWGESTAAASNLRGWARSSYETSRLTGGVEGLGELMGELTSVGAFNDVTSADQYVQKVKDEIGALKQLQSRLRASKEEILGFMGESYSMGINASDLTDGALSRGVLEVGAAMGFESTQLAQAGLSAGGIMANAGISASNAFGAGVTSMIHSQALYNSLGSADQRIIAMGGGVEAMAAGNVRQGMNFMQSDMGQMAMAAMVAGGLNTSQMANMSFAGIMEAGSPTFTDPLSRATFTGLQRELIGAMNPLVMDQLEGRMSVDRAREDLMLDQNQSISNAALRGWFVNYAGYTYQSAAEAALKMGMDSYDYAASADRAARYAPSTSHSRTSRLALNTERATGAVVGFLSDLWGEIADPIRSDWEAAGEGILADVSSFVGGTGRISNRLIGRDEAIRLPDYALDQLEDWDNAAAAGELADMLSTVGSVRGSSDYGYRKDISWTSSYRLNASQREVAQTHAMNRNATKWMGRAIARGALRHEHFDSAEAYESQIDLFEEVAAGVQQEYTGEMDLDLLKQISGAGLSGMTFSAASQKWARIRGNNMTVAEAASELYYAGDNGSDTARGLAGRREFTPDYWRPLKGIGNTIEDYEEEYEGIVGRVNAEGKRLFGGGGLAGTSGDWSWFSQRKFFKAIESVYGDKYTLKDVEMDRIFEELRDTENISVEDWDEDYGELRNRYTAMQVGTMEDRERARNNNLIMTAGSALSNLRKGSLSSGVMRGMVSSYDEHVGGVNARLRGILQATGVRGALGAAVSGGMDEMLDLTGAISKASELADEAGLGPQLGTFLVREAGVMANPYLREGVRAQISTRNSGYSLEDQEAAASHAFSAAASSEQRELAAGVEADTKALYAMMNSTSTFIHNVDPKITTEEEMKEYLSEGDTPRKTLDSNIMQQFTLQRIHEVLNTRLPHYPHYE